MGFYVEVELNVNIYVEDINPEGTKTILLIHGWPGLLPFNAKLY